MEILPHVFLSNSGLTVPSLVLDDAHTIVLFALVLGGALGVFVHRRVTAERIRTGKARTIWPLVALSLLVPPILAVLIVQPDLAVSLPEKGRFRLAGGSQLTPEFTALLVGLALSASAGIAEIVRSGILSVRKGQWEAARAWACETD